MCITNIRHFFGELMDAKLGGKNPQNFATATRLLYAQK